MNRLDNSLLPRLVQDHAGRQSSVAYAKTLSRPALAKSDGTGMTYSVDLVVAGQPDVMMRNVPIANTVGELQYAALGSPITLWKNPLTGKFEVTGFAKQMPGRYDGNTVNGDAASPPDSVDDGLHSHVFTYGELGDYWGGYGDLPYGSYGIFQGATLIEVRV